MRLKVLTTAFVVFGLLLMVLYPWLLGPKPHTRHEFQAFAIRYLIYVSAIVIALIGAGVCSVLILRRAREEYRQAKEELLKQLLEATLKDHADKQPRETP